MWHPQAMQVTERSEVACYNIHKNGFHPIVASLLLVKQLHFAQLLAIFIVFTYVEEHIRISVGCSGSFYIELLMSL